MGLWRTIRKVWATLGAAAFVIFTGWSLLAYRARPDAQAALLSSDTVSVTRGEGFWTFTNRRNRVRRVLNVFFPFRNRRLLSQFSHKSLTA